MILSSEEIKEKIEKENLISNYINLEIQLQPASFDLTLGEVYLLTSSGSINFSNKERKLPKYKKIEFKKNWLKLKRGTYLIVFNEIIKMPNDLIGFLRPRSSLIRSGASIFSSLWDPGYRGKSSSLLVVFNKNGLKVKKNARVAQIVFVKLSKATKKIYSGIYQKEGIE
jgi:dUTP pyrophosphatase